MNVWMASVSLYHTRDPPKILQDSTFNNCQDRQVVGVILKRCWDGYTFKWCIMGFSAQSKSSVLFLQILTFLCTQPRWPAGWLLNRGDISFSMFISHFNITGKIIKWNWTGANNPLGISHRCKFSEPMSWLNSARNPGGTRMVWHATYMWSTCTFLTGIRLPAQTKTHTSIDMQTDSESSACLPDLKVFFHSSNMVE